MNDRVASGSLSHEELLAFAGLAGLLIRSDGRFSEEEEAALEAVAGHLFAVSVQVGGPYREQALSDSSQHDGSAIWDLIERAQVELPDEAAVRAAAERVTHPEAREAIFAAIYEIAASDVIHKAEWPLLDWLKETWSVTLQETKGEPFR